MRFPPALLDEIRARLPVSRIVARKVALKRRGRELVGLSPFKSEKTPSFFVNDQKGFYHCFASGEHGDVFTFLMKTEGLSFPEAVERLAAEAGVALPKMTSAQAEHGDARARLLALLEAATAFFEDQLKAPSGAAARGYLERRGVDRGTVARFRLGFAPPGRSLLKDHLAGLGYSPDELVTSGMLVSGKDVPVSFDRFRNRVIFPITDLKERTIAFGGRALEPNVPAKYLNSPETPLFHKGSVLFNAARARSAAHSLNQVVAVEGYMDVIALAQVGIENVVAPLGTALTEEQLGLLWRMAAEPVLCFDGDGAGRRAAYRAIDTALPLLGPGRSISFAFLPEGLDPDDLVRQQGAEAMRRVLNRSVPLVEVLWEREWSSGQWSTPERRALLEQRISLLIGRIGDASVRQHYLQALKKKLWEAWGARPRPSTQRLQSDGNRYGAARRWPAPAGSRSPAESVRPLQHPRPSSSLKKSQLVGQTGAPPYREALLLRALLNHPWLIEQHAEDVARIEFSHASLVRLRDALLSLKSNDISLDSRPLRSQLEALNLQQVVELVERAITHKCDRFAEPDADSAEVELGWRHALALHERQKVLRTALDAAERAFVDEGSEESLARICEVQRLIASLDGVEAAADT
jgi:DNA primase